VPLVLFLDESGDHSLTKIDPQYPLFVLCGVVMEEDYHNRVATEELNSFKRRLFGRENVILHTAEFTRDAAGFEAMARETFRKDFFTGRQDLVRQKDIREVLSGWRFFLVRREEIQRRLAGKL